MWLENEGRREEQMISCPGQDDLPPTILHLVLHSDFYTGQNKNLAAISHFTFLVHTSHSDTVQCKFVVSGQVTFTCPVTAT
jgi:hypothetical protein